MLIARLAFLVVIVAALSWAVDLRDNLGTSNITVPGAAATVVTDSCEGAGCTATATCSAGIIVWAKGRLDTTTCTLTVSNLTTNLRHRLDCMGATSCAQTEASINDAACIRISCMGN